MSKANKTPPPHPRASEHSDAEATANDASGEKKINQKNSKPGNAASTPGKTMATKKRTRKYSQDFSGHSLTDQSFTASCDVNNIVRHYEKTGIDPYQNRISMARYDDAPTTSYEEALRNAAEAASAVEERGDDPLNWPDLIHEETPLSEAPEPSPSPPAEPPPEAPKEVGNGEEVQ